MIIQVQAGVIHQIKKQSNAPIAQARIHLQNSLHTHNTHLVTFVEYSEQQLQKTGKNNSISGGFGIQHTLSKTLANYYFNTQGTIDYLKISKELANGLYHFVVQKTATTGEYVPIIFYRVDNIDYLLISLISLNKYININAQGEFSDTSVIDNDALKVGLKINLTEMKGHYNASNASQYTGTNYIQWIQRGSSKLPDYIQDFIPVGMKIDNTKTTLSLLKNVEKYLEKICDNSKICHKIEMDVVTLMRTKFDNRESVHIEDDIDTLLDSALTTYGLDDKPSFSTYRQENDIVLDSSFKVDERNLKLYETFDLSLPKKGILIKGNMEQLGENIRVTSDKKILQIKLEEDEAERLTQRYPSLSE